MNRIALKREQKYLTVSACGNLLLGVIGIAAAAVSGSQAILLDGLFNLTYFATSLFTLRVARLVAGGDDERFPYGYAYFEPLVNGIKGMLILSVSVYALLTAVQAILAGGREIEAGIAVGYGLFATLTCGTLAWMTWKGARTTQSPLIKADAENWIVNTVVSASVLLAFAGIFVFRSIGWAVAARYVDPVVVLTVILISLFVPVRMAWHALMSLLNRAPSVSVIQQVNEIVDTCLKDLPVRERFIRVIQPGRQRMVLVHVVMPSDHQLDKGLNSLDEIRLQVEDALCQAHVATIVDILFTADRRWGAPLSDGGAGGGASQQEQT